MAKSLGWCFMARVRLRKMAEKGNVTAAVETNRMPLTTDDAALQARAAATGNTRSPIAERCVAGTASVRARPWSGRRRSENAVDNPYQLSVGPTRRSMAV